MGFPWDRSNKFSRRSRQCFRLAEGPLETCFILCLGNPVKHVYQERGFLGFFLIEKRGRYSWEEEMKKRGLLHRYCLLARVCGFSGPNHPLGTKVMA